MIILMQPIVLSCMHLFTQNGATPLYVAAWQGHSQVAELLLTKGADVNLPMQVQSESESV